MYWWHYLKWSSFVNNLSKGWLIQEWSFFSVFSRRGKYLGWGSRCGDCRQLDLGYQVGREVVNIKEKYTLNSFSNILCHVSIFFRLTPFFEGGGGWRRTFSHPPAYALDNTIVSWARKCLTRLTIPNLLEIYCTQIINMSWPW